jgi:hypothetical protein
VAVSGPPTRPPYPSHPFMVFESSLSIKLCPVVLRRTRRTPRAAARCLRHLSAVPWSPSCGVPGSVVMPSHALDIHWGDRARTCICLICFSLSRLYAAFKCRLGSIENFGVLAHTLMCTRYMGFFFC